MAKKEILHINLTSLSKAFQPINEDQNTPPFRRGCSQRRSPKTISAPKRVRDAEKVWTETQVAVASLMAPLAGPPDKALKEAKAIMKPMRRPMWPMSGVVCATQADPRGMRPPEKSPNRRVKAIIEPRVVMATQQKVIPAVRTPIINKTLNLTKSLLANYKQKH